MATTKTPARKSTAAKPAPQANDAIAMLTNDHKEVKALFKQYDKLVESGAEDEEKVALAEEICLMLTVHATVEEEIFYPAARGVLGDDEDLVDEAEVEHATAKDLIAQIEGSAPEDDALYDAKVRVLGEYIDHHVKEEEGEIFPKAKKGKLGAELGAEMAARKEELMAESDAEA
jgi:hemerythrin superfamily protein